MHRYKPPAKIAVRIAISIPALLRYSNGTPVSVAVFDVCEKRKDWKENITPDMVDRLVEKIRRDYGINYPLPYDARTLCTSVFGLHLDIVALKTPRLRGMSHIPSRSILIDSQKTDSEQNFYCMHEIIHQTLHKNRPTKSYRCYDETPASQDSFIEWEANEGAAQFLIPYQDFIPRVAMYFNAYNPHALWGLQEMLADHYFVSQQVISIRLDNLSYEIEQYRQGVSMENIELLS